LDDLHRYPGPGMFPMSRSIEKNMANVLGEFGGLGLKMLGHFWQPGAHGSAYRIFDKQEDLIQGYITLIRELYYHL